MLASARLAANQHCRTLCERGLRGSKLGACEAQYNARQASHAGLSAKKREIVASIQVQTKVPRAYGI